MNGTLHWARRTLHMKRSAIRELLALTQRPGVISFAGGLPAPELFPAEAITAATAAVLARNPAGALQYGATEGLPELRDWIAARYTSRARPLHRGHVLVTTGSQQALDLLGRVLLDEGDRVVVENPTYLALLTAWRPYGVNFEGVPVDAEGLDVDALDVHGPAPKILYTVPNFQNPTGATLSEPRRRRLVDWLTARDVIAVEDDPYGELRYSGVAAPALAELDAERDAGAWRVIRTGTFSKVLAPGLRVGWVIGPEALIDQLVRAKQAVDLHTSSLDQAIVLELAEQGRLGVQRERLVTAYRERRDTMVDALAARLGETARWSRPDGGMFLWLTLTADVDARRILEAALERGVGFVPGGEFHVRGDGRNTLRLNFTHAGNREIERGVDRLADAIRAVSRERYSG